MSAGLTEQIEHHLQGLFHRGPISRKWLKKVKRRHERRRATADPECQPLYRKYCGWEY